MTYRNYVLKTWQTTFLSLGKLPLTSIIVELYLVISPCGTRLGNPNSYNMQWKAIKQVLLSVHWKKWWVFILILQDNVVQCLEGCYLLKVLSHQDRSYSKCCIVGNWTFSWRCFTSHPRSFFHSKLTWLTYIQRPWPPSILVLITNYHISIRKIRNVARK